MEDRVETEAVDEDGGDRPTSTNTDVNTEESYKGEEGLTNFITHHYQKQKEARELDAEEEDIDCDRTANFFDRALKESQRMSMEVNKSQQKLRQMEAEFGRDLIDAWRNEHASEVLTDQQTKALRKAEAGAYS